MAIRADDVLRALPPHVSPALRAALESDACCIHYTVSEGHCGVSSCGTGWCCYHIVSTGCGLDEYVCLEYPCDTGNFSTGC